jgi:predicted Zn-dependent protease
MRQGLELTTAGGRTRLWSYAEIRQTQGFYAGEEVRLERGGHLPEVLLVADLGFLQSLHELAPELATRFHNPARRGRRRQLTILAAGGAIVLAAVIYLWVIPFVADRVAMRVPVAWEEQLGRGAVTYLAPPEKRCEDPKLTAAVNAIVAQLTAAAPPSPYTFRVYVVDLPIFNAFAAPGGYVVVFRGLLERTRTPEELAGVLAHELQHVLHRHTTRAILQHTSSGLLLAALTGDVTGPLAYGLQTARTLGQLRYSRGAEEEADTDGLKMLLAARVDPAGMIAFFDVLERKSGSGPEALKYLSTHPSGRDRMATLTTLAASSPIQRVKLLSEEDWSQLRNLCGAVAVSPR